MALSRRSRSPFSSINPPKLIQSPLNPQWLIPAGWEQILGVQIDYRLGHSVLHLWRVQWNQHIAGTGKAGGAGGAGGTNAAGSAEPHLHSHHQLLYYQRGEGRLLSGGSQYAVRKGSVFFVPAGCPHQFLEGEGEPALCLALDFTVAEADYATLDMGALPTDDEVAVLLSLLHARQARPFHLHALDQARVDACIASIVEENDRRELGYATMLHAHLLQLISLCLRATRRAKGFGEHFRHTAWRHALVAERAQAFLRQQIASQADGLSLAQTARACAVSSSQLTSILKSQTGHTFQQILLRQRLDHAAALLKSGQANCTEAAFAAGFNDSNYFSRAFRKVYGHAPSVLSRNEPA